MKLDTIQITRKHRRIIQKIVNKSSKGWLARQLGYTRSGTRITQLLSGEARSLPIERFNRLIDVAHKEGVV